MVLSDAARMRIPERIGPTHGVHPKAKVAPKRKKPKKVDVGRPWKPAPEKPFPNRVMIPKIVTIIKISCNV